MAEVIEYRHRLVIPDPGQGSWHLTASGWISLKAERGAVDVALPSPVCPCVVCMAELVTHYAEAHRAGAGGPG